MTAREVVRDFWRTHEHLTRRRGWTQNDYPADTQMAFRDYVEWLARANEISPKVAEMVTL